jgi:hypothetical protein
MRQITDRRPASSSTGKPPVLTTKRMKSKPERGKADTTGQEHVRLSTFAELSDCNSILPSRYKFRQLALAYGIWGSDNHWNENIR